MKLNYLYSISLAVLCSYFFYSLNSGLTITNDGSHFALFDTLVTTGDPELKQVKQFAFGDSALYQGRYYSDRNPGLALFSYAFYSTVQPLETWMAPLFLDPIFAERYNEGQVARIPIVMLVPALSSGILLLGCITLCSQLGIRSGPAFVGALVIIFGTILLRYSTVLYSHVFASALLVWGLNLLFSWRVSPQAWKLGLGGFLLSFAILTEHLLVLALLPATIYLLVSAHRRASLPGALLAAGLGAAIPAGMLMTYNWMCFDSPFSIAHFHHSTDAANHKIGTLLRVEQSFTVALDLLFGAPKSEVGRQDLTGLLSHSPFLYFLLLFPLLFIRDQKKFADEFLVLTSAVVLIILGAASVFAPYAGWDRDYRYFAAAVPLLSPFIAWVIQWLLESRPSRITRITNVVLLCIFAALVTTSIGYQFAHLRHEVQSPYPEVIVNAPAALTNVSLGLTVLVIAALLVLSATQLVRYLRRTHNSRKELPG